MDGDVFEGLDGELLQQLDLELLLLDGGQYLEVVVGVLFQIGGVVLHGLLDEFVIQD